MMARALPSVHARLLSLLLIGTSLACSIVPLRAEPVDAVPPGAREFGIARLKYGGGGDWYEDRTSLVNLMRAARERLGIAISGDKEAIVEPGSAALYQYPLVFACGHGNVKFTTAEVENLRRYLATGGFLWIDDDFGIDASIRRELKRIFPDARLLELPFSHPIFHAHYDF